MIFDLTNDNHIKKLVEFLLSAKEQSIDIKIYKNTRTNRQNRALHLYFDLLSEALNDAGFDMKAVMGDVDIPFTPGTVKSHLWLPIQKAYLETDSTTKLKTNEITTVYDILNKHVGERTGISLSFPNFDYKGYE